MNYIKVKLSDQDIARTETLARARDAKKRKFGAGRHGGLTDSSEQSHAYGLYGEVAVAKYFDIELDTEIYDDHGDFGYDFIIGDLKVDVKTATHFSAYRYPWLKVPMEFKRDKEKIEKCDLFIHCYYDSRNQVVYIQGWATKELVKSKTPERIKNNRTGKPGPLNYIVRTSEFKNIQDLPLTQSQ